MDYIERSVVVQKVMETKWESGSDGAAAMEIIAAIATNALNLSRVSAQSRCRTLSGIADVSM